METPLGLPLTLPTVTFGEARRKPADEELVSKWPLLTSAGSSDFTNHVCDPQSHSRWQDTLIPLGRRGPAKATLGDGVVAWWTHSQT